MTRARAGAKAALHVGVTRDGVRSPVSAERLADAARHVLRAEGVRDALVSVTLLTSREMARLNRRHLDHAGATDVISFGFAPAPGGTVVGDIYLCPDVARSNADDAGCGIREELLRLVVHGTLHVLGWDHPDGEERSTSRMWRRQEALLGAVLRRTAARK